MNVGIIGAGSMGLLFAAKCAQSASDVYVVTRSAEQATIINERGLTVEGESNFTSRHVHAIPIAQLPGLRVHLEWLIIFVKQHQFDEELVTSIAEWTKRGTKVLCFQNGIGHIERLTQHIPEQHIFTAITTEAALRRAANEVLHTGSGTTLIGLENEDFQHEINIDNLMKILKDAGFAVSLSKNMKSVVWRKLLINAVINPLTAILRVNNGALLTSQHRVYLMKALLEEGRAVAQSIVVNDTFDLWEQIVDVCHASAANKSSMLQDVLAERPTEIEWINGAIIRAAHESDIDVPTHEAVYHIIKGL